jgi:hypothetical protein
MCTIGIHEIPLSLEPHSLSKLLRAKLVNVSPIQERGQVAETDGMRSGMCYSDVMRNGECFPNLGNGAGRSFNRTLLPKARANQLPWAVQKEMPRGSDPIRTGLIAPL